MDFGFYLLALCILQRGAVRLLERSEGTVHLLDGLSSEIKGSGTVSLQTHNGIVRKLGEVRYISNFKRNLISLSRLDSSNYRWRADDEILKILHGSRIVLKEKKYGGHYFLTKSST